MHKTSATVMHVISNLNDGGAEGALYRLCIHSHHHKHVVVSMTDRGKYGPMLEAAGIGLYCLEMPQGKPTWESVVSFWRLLRNVRPDIVQTWMYHADLMGGLMARFAGVHRVYWGIRHGNLTPGTVKRSTIFIAKLCAHLSKFVPNRIVSCSLNASNSHVAIGYEKSRMTVIPNGYDVSRFAPDPMARERLRSEWGGGSFVLGMVARFNTQKDHSNLFRALQILKKQGRFFHCVLVGPDMDDSNLQLQLLLQKFNVTNVVRLLGPRTDVSAVMNALDLHVLSSLGEAFPNVLAESMACGTPCVTTDVGDAAYIVGESGWVVQPRDSVALSDAIAKAMDLCEVAGGDWLSRKFLARERIVENFNINRMIDGYNKVWQS
jgi:glycosyltransferase involved in cell wall biosynthesis